MPLGDQARTLLTSALLDPLVVTRYRAKMVQVPATVRIRQSRFTLAVPRRIPRSRISQRVAQ